MNNVNVEMIELNEHELLNLNGGVNWVKVGGAVAAGGYAVYKAYTNPLNIPAAIVTVIVATGTIVDGLKEK